MLYCTVYSIERLTVHSIYVYVSLNNIITNRSRQRVPQTVTKLLSSKRAITARHVPSLHVTSNMTKRPITTRPCPLTSPMTKRPITTRPYPLTSDMTKRPIAKRPKAKRPIAKRPTAGNVSVETKKICRLDGGSLQ